MSLLLKNLLTMYFMGICLFGTCIADDYSEAQMLIEIDPQHQDFVESFYRTLLIQSDYKTQKYSSISGLTAQLKKVADDEIKQIALIINNLNMLNDYYDDPAVFTFIKQLLTANALFAAEQLVDTINTQGDTILSTHANYLLADFYYQRQQWQKTLHYLNTDISYLSKDDFYHALLMKGVSYQYQTQHTLAIQAYQQIPKKSVHYNNAQLNLALANIKLGWWTDAHAIIKHQLKDEKIKENEPILNRLYITLAYSLLNQGYYRTARSAFQQVELNSQYANQATLGIVLTATQQKDDIGALNAARFLKNKKQEELAVYEAHLLIPFLYEKSSQVIAASAGYTEATHYYQDKIASIEKMLASPFTLTALKTQSSHQLNIRQYYPDYYVHNSISIKAYSEYIKEPKLQKKYKQLTNSYHKLSNDMYENILQRRIDNLNSYLNQSRYGLARLFDNNTAL